MQLHSAGAEPGAAGGAAPGGAVPVAWGQRHASWDREGAWLEPALALGLARACLGQPEPAQKHAGDVDSVICNLGANIMKCMK